MVLASGSAGNTHEDDNDAAVGSMSSCSSSNQHPTVLLAEDDDNDDPTNTVIITTSSSSSSSSLLSLPQAVALLTADCLGTGLLALPQNVWILGRTVGLGFLLWNLPLNWYAGTLLSRAADHVEQQTQSLPSRNNNDNNNDEKNDSSGQTNSSSSSGTTGTASMCKTLPTVPHNASKTRDGLWRIRSNNARYSSIGQPPALQYAQHHHAAASTAEEELVDDDEDHETMADDFVFLEYTSRLPVENGDSSHTTSTPTNDDHVDINTTYHIENNNPENDDNNSTRDLIGLTRVLFPHPRATQYQPRATHLVLGFFYTNIFLLLGDYILVMSHAVVAMMNNQICLPWAGVLASTLMLILCQLRTMAHLGHTVTVLSLTTLAVVVVQCLVAADNSSPPPETAAVVVHSAPMLRQWSALASIAFATGPNKLVLNIRHEMKHRTDCPQMLGMTVTVYGVVYVGMVLLAGPNPPSFLFDSIPNGTGRRLAGLLLWIHVAVSYAINSQALCSSMDRLFLCKVPSLQYRPRRRWLYMTLILSISSYIVANAVPFFKDLLALIGALTSIPLTLTLPLVLHRRTWNMPIWLPTLRSLASYTILVLSLVFLFVGLVGALGSIELDWSQQGTPFACSL